MVLDAVRTGQFVIPTSAGYDEQVRTAREARCSPGSVPSGMVFD